MNYIVVAYYTDDQIYRPHAQRLRCSCVGLDIPFDIVCVDSLGCWDKNTHYKPTFIRKMMDKHPDMAIAYTDADSEFVAYPRLFDTLNCDVGAVVIDHSLYRQGRRNRPPEMTTGTMFFNNSIASRTIVDRWIEACRTRMKVWDQKILQELIGDTVYVLPREYYQIFDYMKDVPDPIVRHYQASRMVRMLEKNK